MQLLEKSQSTGAGLDAVSAVSVGSGVVGGGVGREGGGSQTDTSVSLGVELAAISPLDLLNGTAAGGEEAAVGDGDLLVPDPPTVVIDSEDSPPTAKQKKIARVVMAVAFVLLAMCVILVGVTLSMSDHIDELVRQAQLHSRYGGNKPQQQQQQQSKTANANLNASAPVVR